jgi:hypothetical protein
MNRWLQKGLEFFQNVFEKTEELFNLFDIYIHIHMYYDFAEICVEIQLKINNISYSVNILYY